MVVDTTSSFDGLDSNLSNLESEQAGLIARTVNGVRIHAQSALLALGMSVSATGAVADESNIRGEYQVADASGVITPVSLTDSQNIQEEMVFPTEIVFGNTAGESLVISGDSEEIFVAWSLQQVFSVIPAASKPQLEQNWLALSIPDMQQVLSIHSGNEALEGESVVHLFYKNMMNSFLELGRDVYISQAPISDPDGWDGYSAAEISEDWDDFMEKFSEGVTNTDIDYRVIGNPDFFNEISIFFPNHPVTSRIETELGIILGQEQIAEGQEQIAEGQEQIAEGQEQIAEGQEQIIQEDILQAKYRAMILAVNHLSETLEGATEGVATN